MVYYSDTLPSNSLIFILMCHPRTYARVTEVKYR